MKEALLIIDDTKAKVDLPAYLRFVANNPDKLHKLVCPECSKQVHKYNVTGAFGFRVVNQEVGRREHANKRPAPGFHHLDHDAGNDCPLSFANDPRFQGLRERNAISGEVREANLAALAKPGAREAIRKVQRYLLSELTKKPVLTEDQECGLRRIEIRLCSMVGLDKNLWTVGYLGPLLLGPQERLSREGKPLRVEFVPEGTRALPFIGDDGQERAFVVPETLRVCFSPKKATAKPNPMRRGKGGPTIDYEVSRRFAVQIVRDVEAAEKTAAAAAEKAKIYGIQTSLFFPEDPQSPHANGRGPGRKDF